MAHRQRSGSRRDAHQGPAPLPDGFLERLTDLDPEHRDMLRTALRTEPPVSIRLNPRKPFNPQAEAVPWCANGRYLEQRPSFTLDPLLHAGAYYVQEASSMLLEQALRATGCIGADLIALDLCAAPGGKSTHLLDLLGTGSLLVANEVDGARRRALQENLWKWGAVNVLVAGSPPQRFAALEGLFDLILVDAPCSGQGMFRKDADARRQWSARLVERCAAVQAALLPHAWQALSPGGHLIYSTCTWEAAENEAQVARLVDMGGTCLELPIDPAWGAERRALGGIIGYRCYPHRMRGEGFFIAVVRKPGAQEREPRPLAHAPGLSLPWVEQRRPLHLHRCGDLAIAAPSTWRGAIARIAEQVRLEHAGIPMALRKGDGWLPHPAAALSEALDGTAMPRVELDARDAMRYLRGEHLLAQDAEGAALATHRGLGLGWLQGAGKRWNNRWPAPWRIRIAHSKAPAVPWSLP
ncbi:MAG: methyltransferase RsmF C-terminal domain-like protein [Flavobacteriales bacterium]